MSYDKLWWVSYDKLYVAMAMNRPPVLSSGAAEQFGLFVGVVGGAHEWAAGDVAEAE